MENSLSEVKSFTTDITIGDKVYKFKSLTLEGFGEFQNWCNFKKRKETKELFSSFGEEIDTKELMEIRASDDEVSIELNTVKGMLHLLYIIIKDNNEDVDENYVKKNLTIEMINELAEQAIADFQDDSIKGKKTKGKNQKAKSQKKKK